VITLIEALDFRCLRSVSQPLAPFHVLVGPNASGKTTFLDVVAFLGDVVSGGLENAVSDRTANFQDLLWKRQGNEFELAIEAQIPSDLRGNLKKPTYDTVRYQISVGIRNESREIGISSEFVSLSEGTKAGLSDWMLGNTPAPPIAPDEMVLMKSATQNGSLDLYSTETLKLSEDDKLVLNLGPLRSALQYLPGDESRFPVSQWLRSLLADGVQKLVLNSLALRQASAPGRGRHYRPDGSNLPWVVNELERQAPERLADWVAHLQTALPDLVGIRTIERPEDKHRYLMLRYRSDVEVPSWMASDGTLRLLALTLPAYLPDLKGIFLIEEPENGIHPRAIETMYQSLSSVYGAQVLIATHSPVILSLVEASDLLCFAKDREGATDIVLGSDHPALKKWQGETSLSTLFAAGVLGYGE
jgi:predicted ATPase